MESKPGVVAMKPGHSEDRMRLNVVGLNEIGVFLPDYIAEYSKRLWIETVALRDNDGAYSARFHGLDEGIGRFPSGNDAAMKCGNCDLNRAFTGSFPESVA